MTSRSTGTGRQPRTLVVRCPAGPDAGWSIGLEPGSHWLGRTGTGIRVDDPAVEPHHALVEVAADGNVAILQTSGRTAVRVDGVPTTGWTQVPAGAAVEVGASRLVLGTSASVVTSPMAWVFAPTDSSATEHSRFERDVELAAAAARHRRSTRPDGDAIELGVAEVDVPIDIRDADGRAVAAGELDLAAQAIVERHCRTTLPLWIVLSGDEVVAIAAPDPAAVADAIRGQLRAERWARVLVAAPGDAEQLMESDRPMLVLVHDRLDVPPWCGSLLEVGETWRGTWSEDVHGHPDRMVRLHVRGPSRSNRAVPADGDGPASADAGRSFVAQQVASTGTEAGGGIVGVPETTRLQ